MKNFKIIKICKLVSWFFILMFTINSFAAVVNDNDGMVFITKSEFEDLKKDFNGQIDTYNQSLSSKTDGAIAAYLAGVRMGKITDVKNIYDKCFKFGCNNLRWYRYKDASLNPMPVHFLRVNDSILGFSDPKSAWGSHILIQNNDDLMLYENRIMVTDDVEKIFKGVKKCQETISVFSFTDANTDSGASAYSRRYMDNTLYKLIKDKKFNEAQVAIFARSSEKAGSVSISYSEIDKSAEYMETQNAGVTWVTKYNEWGMKKDRERVSALGTMQRACVGNSFNTTTYTNMQKMYEDSYKYMLDNFGTTPTDIPIEIGDTTSSYDYGSYYAGTEAAYWSAPIQNPGGAGTSFLYRHGSAILNPFYDICCVYIGNLLDWKNADDTDISGIDCTYQQGRPICKCDEDGELTIKVTCHGTGKLKFYVNTRGDDMWYDIRGNKYGGRTRKWSTVDEYDADYASWNNDLLYTDGETKTIKLKVEKDDYVFGLMCDNSTDGSWMKFDELSMKNDDE